MKKIKMDFISSASLSEKEPEKRINFILNKIKDGSILVIDGVLKPEEEMNLIRETMRRVDEGFPGIEVCSLKKPGNFLTNLVDKFMDRKEDIQRMFGTLTGNPSITTNLRTGLTFIGPAKVIKKIKKNPDSFSVLAEV
ncbi:MAG: DUF2073 domain-containing protein [Candidatus Aenigmatarchaeota archaeon]|nr:DUF2073 domain-containing protein [Candidatus Aenigmarchaeota archaeon]MCX8178270.1 DUF2073 domain-containing protein [Candidatus Aenigmarchaeota archaeon]